MVSKNVSPLFRIVGISVMTSVVVSLLTVFVYLRMTNALSLSTDPTYDVYSNKINNFLNTIRKGDIETAYKQTSSTFQKLTSLEDFTQLMQAYKANGNIPSKPCKVISYTDSFSTTIATLSGQYNIVQTKCEVAENGKTKGFAIEFMKEHGISKISYVNVYQSPVIHSSN